MVIYQSYHAGAPVVGSAIGGIPELIDEGETGYLSPSGDAVALADQVLAHFARPARQQARMRMACLKRVRTSLTLEQHLDAMQQVFCEALAA